MLISKIVNIYMTTKLQLFITNFNPDRHLLTEDLQILDKCSVKGLFYSVFNPPPEINTILGKLYALINKEDPKHDTDKLKMKLTKYVCLNSVDIEKTQGMLCSILKKLDSLRKVDLAFKTLGPKKNVTFKGIKVRLIPWKEIRTQLDQINYIITSFDGRVHKLCVNAKGSIAIKKLGGELLDLVDEEGLPELSAADHEEKAKWDFPFDDVDTVRAALKKLLSSEDIHRISPQKISAFREKVISYL